MISSLGYNSFALVEDKVEGIGAEVEMSTGLALRFVVLDVMLYMVQL
jgi:hypothetical protein